MNVRSKTLLVLFMFTFDSITSSELSTLLIQSTEYTKLLMLHDCYINTHFRKLLHNLKKQPQYVKNESLVTININLK